MKSKSAMKVIIPLAVAAIPFFLLAPGYASKRKKAPFMKVNFAHRGLHSRDRSIPENSLAAFEKAAQHGYGIELDVQLTADGEVVVFHDDTLDRVCGVSGRIDEWCYDDLCKLSLCGTEEHIPLLSEALGVIRGRGPLIVELKNGQNNKELCEKTYAQLQRYRGDVCVESFNPFILAWFRIHARELLRGQLAAPKEEYTGQNRLTAFLLSNGLLNFICRPQFMAYKIGRRPISVRFTELLGAMKVAWTAHEPMHEQNNDAVIFEYYKPRTQYK